MSVQVSLDSDFQRGMPGLGMPPFQAGMGGLGFMAGSKQPFAQDVKHVNFLIAQLKSVDNDSDYLDDHYVFSFKAEHMNLTDKVILDRFNMAARRPKPRGKDYVNHAHQQYKDGFQHHGHAVVALNLPCVNWLLARECERYNPTVADYPVMEGASDAVLTEMKKCFLPPVETIINMIYPLGGMITPAGTRQLQYKNGLDVRVVCVDGACDVLNIWSTAHAQPGSTAERLTPMTYVGFVLRAKEVKPADPTTSERLTFTLDSRTTEHVLYSKKYVWRIEPIILNRGTVIDQMRDPRVVNEVVRVGDKGFLLRIPVHVWKVGMLGGPSNESPWNPRIGNNPCCNAKEMAGLNKVELWTDFIGSHTTHVI